MENGTVQKGQNLLEDFVWPIDTGRLMGDPLISDPLIFLILIFDLLFGFVVHGVAVVG
jgi:hypothetical protein